ELAGWDVGIADAQRARALAPLACKTDRIDAQVLAELARRDLVPEVWLPDPRVRGERERARFRLHLVKHRTMLKNRINQTLVAHGLGRPTRHLFGPKGRLVLERLPLPAPWHATLRASLVLIESLDEQISELERELRAPRAAHTAGRTTHSRPIVTRMRARHGRRRGSAIASVEIARKLTEAIWWMLTRNQPFAPPGAL